MNRLQYASNDKIKSAFLISMGTLLFLFLLLLVLGNVGIQTDIIYLDGRDFQADTLKTEEYARELDPYGYGLGAERVPFPHANYPPIAYVFYWLEDGLSGRDIHTDRAMAVSIACMLLCAGSLYLALWGLGKGRRLDGALIPLLLLLSGPSVYAFERGNIIFLAVALAAFFLYGYRSENRIVRELSFLALALSAALKVYPALLGLLLLGEKRWKEAARLALYGAAMAFLPFLLLRGGFANIPLLLENVEAHKAFYNLYTYPRFGFRLFSSAFYDAHWASPLLENNLWRVSEWMQTLFPKVDLLLTLGCLLYALTDAPLWKKACAVTAVLISYPLNSGSYTALYALPVIALFLGEGTHSRGDGWYLALFLLLLNPVQIPLPYGAIGLQDTLLCNLTDVLQNLAAYALFLLFAGKGYLRWGKAFLRKKPGKPAGNPAC